MGKPTENQAAAVAVLKDMTDNGFAYVDALAWKKHAKARAGSGEPAKITAASLVKAGLIEEIKVAVSGRVVFAYRPKV